jgi:hypothetical protein
LTITRVSVAEPPCGYDGPDGGVIAMPRRSMVPTVALTASIAGLSLAVMAC